MLDKAEDACDMDADVEAARDLFSTAMLDTVDVRGQVGGPDASLLMQNVFYS